MREGSYDIKPGLKAASGGAVAQVPLKSGDQASLKRALKAWDAKHPNPCAIRRLNPAKESLRDQAAS